ncbi:MAG: LysM peptidoglycan-binding domain-containing protein [Anaerolineae bacterium]|nr:LysM peptidoglycan-binding domain-containing protein [Anaerolineae bacterium]
MKYVNRFTGLLLLSLLLLLAAAGVVRADTTYVIQPGDSLFRIALQFGVTVDDIVQANNIVNPNLIIAGQELVIPDVDGPAAGQPVPPPAATVPAGTTPPVTGGTAVGGGVIHVIQPGESLFRISLIYNVSMADIVAANELANASLIIAGQELFIPGATALGRPRRPPALRRAGPRRRRPRPVRPRRLPTLRAHRRPGRGRHQPVRQPQLRGRLALLHLQRAANSRRVASRHR